MWLRARGLVIAAFVAGARCLGSATVLARVCERGSECIVAGADFMDIAQVLARVLVEG